MNKTRAKAMAIDLMTQHGLIQKGWIFRWTRAKRTLGQCDFRGMRIKLSELFVELNDETEVRDTILHEIAHALVGTGHGHDWVWKAKCMEIGARPRRTAGEEVTSVRHKWKLVCPSCQTVAGYRHAKRNEHRRGSCVKCSGGRFNPLYRVVFVPNDDEEVAA